MALPLIARRRFLTWSASAAGTLFFQPQILLAKGPTDRRFIFIIQRGAADGLNIVIPYADPAYVPLRRELAISSDESLKLDGLFALHPSLFRIGEIYGQGQALFIHAVASSYRDRSHFDGQNILETGGLRPYAVKDGWLNRLLGLMPDPGHEAIALAATVPLALRGRFTVQSYAPSGLPAPSDDLIERAGYLYATDAELHALWAAGMEARADHDARSMNDPASLGKMTASLLAAPEGPRIAMLETVGWDTHTNQAFRLGRQLRALDTLVASLRDGLGNYWDKTTILIATEFGRTAAANGTGGTDHGTGSVAMLIGGSVKGGRVLSDWPGLAAIQLYEGRDLRPTMALSSIFSGAAAEGLGLEPEMVARHVFPDMNPRPQTELIIS